MRNETQGRAPEKKRRGWIVPVALLAVLLLTGSMLMLLDGRHVRFYMTGEQEMRLEYGSDYSEPGIYAVTVGRLFGERPEHLRVETLGRVDTHRLGTYVLRYTVRWFWGSYETERRVTIVDTTPPVITLKTVEGYEPTWMTGYAEEGYTAVDACDGDLTGKVRRSAEAERIVYTVSDASGNSTTVVRELPALHYDPPVLTMLGDRHITMEAGLSYEDPGCTAVDNLGNDLTGQLRVDSSVVPWLAGEYEVRYSLLSQEGKEVSDTRRVTVLAKELPEEVLPEEKTIYLTFDDGPGPYTAKLLDLLKKYNVKATFFVTDQQHDYIELIAREVKEGHSVGVHTKLHNYDDIYASEENYFRDFFAMEEIIRQQTGSYTQLFRFPGGSSNTVSRINPGIMTRLTRAMNDMGYQYFDWNVLSGDAGGTKKTKEIIENIKKGCEENKVAMILQHDIKDYSVAAVEEIIKWGLENGYSFKALTMDSPAMHHTLNN